jgi:hypothetical protein
MAEQKISEERLNRLYAEWRTAVQSGMYDKARELREMYLALLDRQAPGGGDG